MKLFTQIAAALLATTALAAPAPPKPSDQMTFYNLRITSKANKSLDGKLLSIHKDQVGVHPGAEALRFYPVEVPEAEGSFQLHTHPFGIVESVLGLVGSNGLGTLTQISNPGAVEYPDGTSADWSSWAMVEGSDGVDGEPGENYLDYLGSAEGKWIAFPSGNQDDWVVTWYEGTGAITQDFMPIDVTYEKAD